MVARLKKMRLIRSGLTSTGYNGVIQVRESVVVVAGDIREKGVDPLPQVLSDAAVRYRVAIRHD